MNSKKQTTNSTQDYLNYGGVNVKTSNMFDKQSFNKNTNSDIAEATGDESLKSPAILVKKNSVDAF